jgi:hypothetical protein
VIPDGGTASMAEMKCASPSRNSPFAWQPICRRDVSLHRQEVLDAVGTLHPAIEIPIWVRGFRQRWSRTNHRGQCCAHLFVLGAPTASNWRGSIS